MVHTGLRRTHNVQNTDKSKTYFKLDSLRWFSQRRSPTPHFGDVHPGSYDSQIRTWPRFLYNAPTPKFHRPMFTRSEHTSKQKDAAKNPALVAVSITVTGVRWKCMSGKFGSGNVGRSLQGWKCRSETIGGDLATMESQSYNIIHNTSTMPNIVFLFLTVYPVFSGNFSSNLLQVARTNLIFGFRSFRAAAPTVWNSLPDSVRSSNTLISFRRHLKTHYF